MITLEEIIIGRGDLEKVYKSNVALTLWRGLNNADDRRNPLYPDFEKKHSPMATSENQM